MLRKLWLYLCFLRCYLSVKLVILFLKIKWFALGPYYQGLLAQAGYLYRQSELFTLRWQALGLDFAEERFKDDAGFFFNKAKREPWQIKWQILWDVILGRELRPYYLEES